MIHPQCWRRRKITVVKHDRKKPTELAWDLRNCMTPLGESCPSECHLPVTVRRCWNNFGPLTSKKGMRKKKQSNWFGWMLYTLPRTSEDLTLAWSLTSTCFSPLPRLATAWYLPVKESANRVIFMTEREKSCECCLFGWLL